MTGFGIGLFWSGMPARLIDTVSGKKDGAGFMKPAFPPLISDLPTPVPTATPVPPPESHIIPNDYHIFQTYNNCGPASLSMALSYYGISRSQAELGNRLRPFQVPGGDNDDKNVTLAELAAYVSEYGFTAYHRPAGTLETIRAFVSRGLPVLTRTLTAPSEDIGHFRVIKGYDDAKGVIIQDDSLQGHNLEYSFADFNLMWKYFGYEYLVLVPQTRIPEAEAVLGEDADPDVAWQKAVKLAEDRLRENPGDVLARFNLSVALYHTGDFRRSAGEFEKVEHSLPFRTLWYQLEPVISYFELGEDERVLEIAGRILNNHNRAYSELYLLRGHIYRRRGETEAARKEYELAVYYNHNLREAHDALASVSTIR